MLFSKKKPNNKNAFIRGNLRWRMRQVLWEMYCNKSTNTTGEKLANGFLLSVFRPPSSSKIPVSIKFELFVFFKLAEMFFIT